ncbi:MAG: redoxin domain-containing protein [FCB group bacterium]|nr:redoxin domain-containing protein [FCB group bacterium]
MKIITFFTALVGAFSLLTGQIPYDIGATISLEHRETELALCANGDGTFRLEDFNAATNGGNARVIWISFFTSWCTNCQAEVPHMAALYDQYQSAGLEIISLGRQWNFPYSCDGWAGLGADYPLVDDEATNAWQWFGLGYVPQNIFIDYTMTVRYSLVGFDLNQTVAILDELLGELPAVSVDTSPPTIAGGFTMAPVYPNPFNPRTSIRFTVEQDREPISLSVIDATGREIYRQATRTYAPGEHEISWDGQGVPSGLVFFILESPTARQIQKAILLK